MQTQPGDQLASIADAQQQCFSLAVNKSMLILELLDSAEPLWGGSLRVQRSAVDVSTFDMVSVNNPIHDGTGLG